MPTAAAKMRRVQPAHPLQTSMLLPSLEMLPAGGLTSAPPTYMHPPAAASQQKHRCGINDVG